MSKTTPKPPAREEWDFSKCPENRLEFCHSYEFARELMLRESPAFLKFFEGAQALHKAEMIEKARKKGKNKHWYTFIPNIGFDDEGTWHYGLQGASDHRSRCFMKVIDAPLGFPYEPYLKVKHYITPRSHHPFPPEAGIKPWWVMPQVFYKNGTFFKGDLREDLNLPPEKVAMFWIDWSFSPNEIVKAFKTWVDLKHPKDFDDRRGKKPLRKLRYDLNALGAWRLIKALGSAAAAIEHTAEFSDDCKGLFKQPSGWTDAQKRIRKILADWKQALADSGIK